ncbi:universal stress protein [Halopiger aswanensis]|uniref:Nucleotide-binding universal stress UspA family protein n=1 Tax=Halopiger aswanensis TaxID=148449 RepID=A0A3R7DFG4_9EURY|nr:universal stress protein [Halopiger aswanensis]RKD97927.1 nucleotide-binding universal stress UspA family protein [Halopiger aswanensis]
MATRVLVPMDGSEPAEAALEYVLEMHPEADITVLHVIELEGTTLTVDDGLGFDDEVQRGMEEQAEAVFDRAQELAEEAAHEGDLETTTGIGDPTRSIIDAAADADLVVIGSHGRHGAARLLLGSVAETVARRSPVPVTIVR